MPILMLVLLVFVVLVRLCAAQMALQSAVSQTARQLAAHIHPAELALQQAAAANPLAALPGAAGLAPWSEIAAEAAGWLPSPAGDIASSALRGDFRPLHNLAAAEMGRGIVEPLLRDFADQAVIEPERLRLTELMLPDVEPNGRPYLSVAAEYEFPVKLPLLGRPIILEWRTSERAWISDTAPARYGNADDASERLPLQIVDISPKPLRPGLKATVLVKTAPGASVSIDVKYKSGSSKAKHLVAAAADAEGYISWTWHVSGNTTPGLWELTVSETADANHKVSMHFLVEKRASAH